MKQRLMTILLAVLVAILGSFGLAAPASAMTYLCQSPNFGFSCVSFSGYSGQSTWGYPVDNRGHNCTNYAAFRLAQNGASNPGNLGNAADWDNNASAKGFAVNGTPAVGAIAQWNSNVYPAGPSGHVAYVETVTSSYIEITEDNWGGTTNKVRYIQGQSGWPSNFIHIKDVDGSSSLPGRIAVVDSGSTAVKVGPLNATWSVVGGGSQVKVSPNRVASYNNGALYVKEGAMNSPWVQVASNVDSFDITDSRVGIMVNGQLSIKQGGLNAQWSHVGGGDSFKMSPNRIALYTGGQLQIKEGPLNAMWSTVTGNVDAYEVTDNRIGILVGGQLSIKNGALNATWSAVGGGSSFKMSPNRIALYDHGGQLVIKEGPLNAMWHSVTGNIDSFDVTDNRIGILVGGQLSVKEGPLNVQWIQIGGGQSFDMS
ncbi:MAG: CHAP domain-containing protein [Chloroflexi bacterium]|nr:MAG: CHAP domain-containing protein [Chloroflexota bacterium]